MQPCNVKQKGFELILTKCEVSLGVNLHIIYCYFLVEAKEIGIKFLGALLLILIFLMNVYCHRYEIDKVTAGQRLDLNLERG